MGGMKPTKPKQSAGRRRQVSGGDECDLRFRTDLMGVRSATAESVRPGDSLEIVLLQDKAMRSVVCRTRTHEVVGALSAFPGSCTIDWVHGGRGARMRGIRRKIECARSCTVFVYIADQAMIVIGGTYIEECDWPEWKRLMGPGARAALAGRAFER